MKCDKCKSKEADINIGYLRNNRKKNVFLCESCSDSMGIAAHVRNGFDNNPSEEDMQYFSVDYELHCTCCDTDIGHLLATGQTGCSHCYSVFRNEIDKFFIVKNPLNNDMFQYSEPLRDRFNEFIEH